LYKSKYTTNAATNILLTLYFQGVSKLMKGKSGLGKITSDVTVADELDSWMKTKQLLRPEDQLELSEQVSLY
jgi:hypothetical protein